ncbi:MAG TPA: DNA starvation/stationary phase protection protein [Cyanobacteria bacterium UBA8803]|nr:DNA starvation/stationary phase protection protein [Cyanobacteria bacterium UBA9273]HBL57014.1 DNA starvation/stationary phase protection protein [Cyanobacteria bacterium UBA8803]
MNLPLNSPPDYPEEVKTPQETFNDRLDELKAQVDIYTSIEQEEHIILASGLSQLLEDTYNIYLKTHGCRWKATDSLSESFDELLEKQYTEMTAAVEELTERLRALGMPAPDPYSEFLRLSAGVQTKSFPSVREMIPLLVEGNQVASRQALIVREQAQAASYFHTAQLLTERMNVHQRNASILRSYLNSSQTVEATSSSVADMPLF